jgi:hypothetical protein
MDLNHGPTDDGPIADGGSIADDGEGAGSVTSMPTLGERLDAQARQLAARLLPSFPWAGPLEVVTDRAVALAAPYDGRFERVETRPDGATSPRPGAGRPIRTIHSAPLRVGQDDSEPRPAPRGADAAPAGRPLPDGVRSRLREVAGAGADAMRVHHGDAADAVAREHRADAVTIGRDVHFRRGRYQPHDDRGFGLLAHEAAHVLALLQPGADWRRATGAGRRDEESDALTRERAAIARPGGAGTLSRPDRRLDAPTPDAPRAQRAQRGRRAPAPPHRSAEPGPAVPPPAQAARATTPLTAATDRDVTVPAPPRPLDLAALRRDLMNDLMRQLRTDFERGG